jgi:hypothetical protein
MLVAVLRVHHTARGIEEWTPPPHNKLFLCIPNYQNIFLMAGEWGQQEEKAR